MNDDNLHSAATQRTVLVVDDQRSICVSLEYLLVAAGYRVVTAESGVAAVATLQRDSIDGALIDIHMPGMNGFDTCVRLQEAARERGYALRIWFMTGAFTRDLEIRGAELGALGVLRKPFDFPALLAGIEVALSVLPRALSEGGNLKP